MKRIRKIKKSDVFQGRGGRSGELFLAHIRNLDQEERLWFLIRFAHAHNRSMKRRKAS